MANNENRILTIRSEKGLSQPQLARLAGKTPGYISLLEQGKCGASIATLRVLARALGVGVSALLGEKEQDNVAVQFSRGETVDGLLVQGVARRDGTVVPTTSDKLIASDCGRYLLVFKSSRPIGFLKPDHLEVIPAKRARSGSLVIVEGKGYRWGRLDRRGNVSLLWSVTDDVDPFPLLDRWSVIGNIVAFRERVTSSNRPYQSGEKI